MEYSNDCGWMSLPISPRVTSMSHRLKAAGEFRCQRLGWRTVWRRLDQCEIWLLKIDTEGAEGDILEGASEAMLSAVRYAIVEYHDNICPGVSSRCRQVLKAAGFTWQERVHPWDEGIIYARRI